MLMLLEAPLCHSRISLSHRGRAVTTKEKGCGERSEMKMEGGGVRKPGVLFQV